MPTSDSLLNATSTFAEPARPRGWRTTFAAWLEPSRVDEPVAGMFRARQLQAIVQLSPFAAVANLVNAGIIATSFWGRGHNLYLAAWTLALALIGVPGVMAWRRWRRSPDWHTSSRRSMTRATWRAAALGLIWATMPIVLLPIADPSEQLLLVAVATGIMCGGGFLLAAIPAAGATFVLICGLGAAIGLVMTHLERAAPLFVVTTLYGLTLLGCIASTARIFSARMMAEAAAERHGEVVSLLLRDLEENAIDAIWHLDPQGRVESGSHRAEALFGRSTQKLVGRRFADVLRALLPPGDASAAAQLATLVTHLDRGQGFRDLAVSLRTGWWSFSGKPVRDNAGQSIGWRGSARDISEAHRTRQELRRLAHFDALTGLANRRQFRDRLVDWLAQASQDPPQADAGFAVLMLDLDHFKTINDTLGHAMGDSLLKQVATRLRKLSREGDLVARLGGDEFALLLKAPIDREQAAEVARSVLEALRPACVVGEARVSVRSSVGIAMAPADGDALDTLLKHADLALYAAKAAGRDEFCFFEADMAAQARRRMAIEQGLREALAREQLHLVYQPQIRLSDGQVIGCEALLRWQHPELGNVSPAEFIPVAEESGLIAEIGTWALDEACRQAASWPAPLSISVNVSPVQAMSQDLVHIAQAALERHGLPAERLELEITESIFMGDTQATLGMLHALRGIGLRIALDDFGTGYSSLAYLRRFPFDTLKIDRAFIRELRERRDARAIVKLIVGLARTLGIDVVAEGVEAVAEATLLRAYGCDAMQGYLVARPLAPDAIRTVLEAGVWHADESAPDSQPLDTSALPLHGVHG